MLIPKENNSTIDVNQVRDFFSKNSRSSAGNIAIRYETLKIFLQILSGQFPPERYNGVVNVMFVGAFDFATTDEIQSALVNFIYFVFEHAVTKNNFRIFCMELTLKLQKRYSLMPIIFRIRQVSEHFLLSKFLVCCLVLFLHARGMQSVNKQRCTGFSSS